MNINPAKLKESFSAESIDYLGGAQYFDTFVCDAMNRLLEGKGTKYDKCFLKALGILED